MTHMPATGVSGVDLYAEDGEGISRWVNGVGAEDQKVDKTLAQGLAPGSRYTLYFPLYSGVDKMEIGVEKGNFFNPLHPRKEKPILLRNFYYAWCLCIKTWISFPLFWEDV